MTPKTFLSAAVSGFVLLGCAYPWPSVTSRADCNSQHCEVAVTPTQHDMPGYSCFVEKAVPTELHVRHQRPVIIDWYLDTASAHYGYRFPDNGIVFDNPTGWECRNVAEGKLFQCTNKADGGWHKYTVNVIKGSTRCDPLDPWVVNQ